jgi:hypothetical protein
VGGGVPRKMGGKGEEWKEKEEQQNRREEVTAGRRKSRHIDMQ